MPNYSRLFAICLAFAGLSQAAPIIVTLNGNFGPGSGGTTILDNQNYSISFIIPDPHTPTTSFDAPGGLGPVSATYHVPAQLAIPGLAFFTATSLDVNYNQQDPVGNWFNLFSFTGLPVGDFMVATPVQTVNGDPVWNGLAGSLGQPEISLLNNVPVHARFFVEQNTPNMGPIPLAVYDAGSANIIVVDAGQPPIPEPGTLSLLALGAAWMAGRRLSFR